MAAVERIQGDKKKKLGKGKRSEVMFIDFLIEVFPGVALYFAMWYFSHRLVRLLKGGKA